MPNRAPASRQGGVLSANRARLTIRQAFHVSREMDAAVRKAATEDAGVFGIVSVSDWIRGAIAARLEARAAKGGDE